MNKQFFGGLLLGLALAVLGVHIYLSVHPQATVVPADYLNEGIYTVGNKTYSRAEVLDWLIVSAIKAKQSDFAPKAQ